VSGELSANLDLLDALIVDSNRLPIGRVDDLELAISEDGPPRVAALLTGAEALGERIGGAAGAAIARPAARLRGRDDPPGPARIDAALMDKLWPMIRLSVTFDELPHVAGLESWLAEYVGRLPWSGAESPGAGE
jgi:hypothetical protein